MHISFDLDGTIIDSMESVKKSFKIALEINHLETKKEIKVGPPLDQLLVTHVGDDAKLKRLIRNSFIKVYDENLAITATLYNGIENVLRYLETCNNTISLVTNKRKYPTYQILRQYNLTELFDIIICSDESNYGSTKLERLLNIRIKDKKNIYIGDTHSDYLAATEANYHFLSATWGYDNLNKGVTLNRPQEILEYIYG
jgi:phosphoglycolate phosphatase-like HAD superfamily hydrolase